MNREELEAELDRLIARYGEWEYDIPLPHGVWTRGNEGIPHTRVKRIVQIASDLTRRQLSECRVLDLGCLDGQFSVEFALQGATVVGLEAREGNITKAEFVGEVWGLDNLTFVQEDVRNLRRAVHGPFDVIVCSGLLYHLNRPDVFTVVQEMYEMVTDVLIIDTHIWTKKRTTEVEYDGRLYHGREIAEHSERDSEEAMNARSLSSWRNTSSFWFTRPSIINLLRHVGFSSVYEAFNPPHLNFGQPGLEHKDRCTFAALKRKDVDLHTSPAANALEEDHPEGSLTY